MTITLETRSLDALIAEASAGVSDEDVARAKATAEQLASSPVAFGPVRMFAKDEVGQVGGLDALIAEASAGVSDEDVARAKATAEQLASSPVAFGPVRMFAKDEVSN